MSSKKAPYLAPHTIRKLLRSIEGSDPRFAKRNMAMMLCSLAAGLRITEIACLNIGDVLDSHGELRDCFTLRPETAKGNKARDVYFTNKKLKVALRAYLDERAEKYGLDPSDRLFLTYRGKGFALTRKKYRSKKTRRIHTHYVCDSAQELFTRIYKKAKIFGASSHSGRRTYATRLIDRNYNLMHVRALMGHSSISTTQIYIESHPAKLARMNEAVL